MRKKFTSHCARKTIVTKLKKAKIVISEHIANVTGHRGINFLNDYDEADEEELIRYRKPFLALLGDRSYFPFNRRSENRAQATSRASLGKSLVSTEVERRSLVNLYRISMQEDPH